MESSVRSAKEILRSPDVTKYLPYNCKWWSKYIYHFSHVVNIATILNNGYLLSRNSIEKNKITQSKKLLNENASLDVIGGTDDYFKDFVRFYFRPLTPTQYHNEGIRCKNEITTLGAHCPVPVFLLFDTAILDDDNTFFSYETLASHRDIPIYQGIETLKEAPFEYIYHNSATTDNQIRKHRQAEVIVRDKCELTYLRKIICRNKAEKDTLIALLNRNAKRKYRGIIYTIGESNCDATNIKQIYYGTHLNIQEVLLNKKELTIYFNKQDAISNSRKIEIIFFDHNGEKICSNSNDAIFLGKYGEGIVYNMQNKLDNYSVVIIVIKLDDSLVYCNVLNI